MTADKVKGLNVGDYLGPYHLQRFIARGGMAEIYLAEVADAAGETCHVALKVIQPELSRDEQFVRMLLQEARIASRLDHPHIVDTFDFSCLDNAYFITMEYVDGVDYFQMLRELSRRGEEMPIPAALLVGRAIADALAYAHAATDEEGRPLQIIHRDVSPQNILLSRVGEVKLTDFGVAKAANTTFQTRRGVIKGKLVYMSPEQAAGDPTDARSDIFSAGIVLYEALTGGSLYNEQDQGQLLQQVRHASIRPPSTRRAALTPPLDDLVMRALAPQPSDRYATAEKFRDALDALIVEIAPGYGAQHLAQLVEQVLDSNENRTTGKLITPMHRENFAIQAGSMIKDSLGEPAGADKGRVIIESVDVDLEVDEGAALAEDQLQEVGSRTDSTGASLQASLKLVGRGSSELVVVGDELDLGRGSVGGLVDGRVSRKHARIIRQDDSFFLEDLESANGTYLNGDRLDPDRPLELSDGDSIRLGPHELKFQLELRNDTAPSPVSLIHEIARSSDKKTPRVVQLEDDAETPSPERSQVEEEPAAEDSPTAFEGASVTIQLADDTLTLPVDGQLPLGYQLFLGDRGLGPGCATIEQRSDGYWVVPDPAGNGILINGSSTKQETPLRSGDNLQVGPLEISFRTHAVAKR